MLANILAAALAAAPAVGVEAPDFTAADADGKAVTLSGLLKGGPVILAFFPKAFTPG